MKGIKLLTLLSALLIIFGSGVAVNTNAEGDGNGSHYFDIGNFGQCESGGVTGKYAISGLEGCIISVYSDNESHLLDITYEAGRSEMYLQILDNELLDKLLEKEGWLKEYICKLSYKKLTFEGSQCKYSDEDCSIEMHDTSIQFLKICTTGDIIFSNLQGYNTKKIKDNIIELSKENFSGTIVSNYMLEEKSGGIVAHRTAMFRGVDTKPLSDGTEEMKTVEDAIKTGSLGGEITIIKEGGEYKVDSISYYDNVTIGNKTTPTSKKAEFTVSGDEHTAGKTIKVNIGKGVLSVQGLRVMFDGKEIPMAEDIADVLNPNDDGLQPEYVLVNVNSKSGGEFFLLISIPHFSVHDITIESIVKNPVFIGMAVCSAISILVVATWILFKRE
ncbi:MAG: hypothetical protein U9O96_02195 [Candidatus Thermoplasmatota archaeon]|nr:hypothetical protein [Candidatus Thermoplasmatota archaeon]